jgi:hypothetical protein
MIDIKNLCHRHEREKFSKMLYSKAQLGQQQSDGSDSVFGFGYTVLAPVLVPTLAPAEHSLCMNCL